MKQIELIGRTKEQESELLSRIEKLQTSEVIGILSQLDNSHIIIDSCETRAELDAVLLCNMLSDNIDEIELIICESGN